LDLGGEFVGEGVEAIGQIANVLEEVVIGNECGDSGEEARGGGDKGFSDTWGDGAKAGGAGSAEAREGVNDAPDGAEETDEGSDASGCGQPRHTLFDAANFLGGCQLHADRDGLERFHFGGRRIASARHLGLKFAIAGGVNVGKGRAGGDESLRIGDAFGGAENFEELIALTPNASEQAELLEDESPRDQREEEQDGEDDARDQARLRKNFEEITNEECG
jgi:hypothetical protein